MGNDDKTIRILVVDDEQEFAQTLSERIKMREIAADVALDGEQALESVSQEIPDVMVLDLRMPGIDGMEVLRRVKQNYPHLQVIILTGKGSAQDQAEAMRLGAYEYLEKPVEVDTLVDKIRRAYSAAIENTLMAGTFAEAGDFDTAAQYLDKGKTKKK